MKKAFLVSGPEGSGNRLLLKLLQAAGCAPHTKPAEQDWQTMQPEGELIALMRSMPHGGEWTPVKKLVAHLKSQGYSTEVLIPVRDYYCIAATQCQRNKNRTMEQALARIKRGYSHVVGACIGGKIPYRLVSVESLMLHPNEAKDALCRLLELPSVEFEIRNENAKHYAIEAQQTCEQLTQEPQPQEEAPQPIAEPAASELQTGEPVLRQTQAIRKKSRKTSRKEEQPTKSRKKKTRKKKAPKKK